MIGMKIIKIKHFSSFGTEWSSSEIQRLAIFDRLVRPIEVIIRIHPRIGYITFNSVILNPVLEHRFARILGIGVLEATNKHLIAKINFFL